jgi:hypothetical protein
VPVTDDVRILASGCLTPFGLTDATHAALVRGERALTAHPVLGREGGDPVPLALLPGRTLDEAAPPAWLEAVRTLVATIPGEGWGTPRRPVFFTSSNFGVGNLLSFRRDGNAAHLAYGSPGASVDWLRRELGWGESIFIFSHACVSAHLGLLQATRLLRAGAIERALVFSYDFLSPFVAGGFHALKILNASFPAPYANRPEGAIGLGDGAAFAVLTRDAGEFALSGQHVFNELAHFTANKPDGSGFAACFAPVAAAVGARGLRVWCKGHGTGTLEAGRLEAAACAHFFPDAPLVSWKGSLGHTLGSSGLVELAIAVASLRTGQAPGTIGATAPTFTSHVALETFATGGFDAVACTSNAFGGAHAALLLHHV